MTKQRKKHQEGGTGRQEWREDEKELEKNKELKKNFEKVQLIF